MFRFGSSVCEALQCLISTVTRQGKSGHLFRLICSVVLWRERDTANKCHWRVWARSEWMDTWGFPQPKAACTSQVQAAQLPKCSKRAQSHVGRAPPWGSWSQAVTLLADRNRPGSQECMVSYWDPAHYLVEDVISGAKTAAAPCLLILAVTHLPLCFRGGRTLNGSQLALLWYSLGHNPLFC